MTYLGSPGRMVKLKCPVSQRDTADEGYRFVTTLEGRRKAQVVPGGRRVWEVSTGQLTTPAELAVLREFSNGAWGPGPFWFVPEGATLVNLLAPQETSHPIRDNQGVPGGPMPLEDGTIAATSKANGANFISWRNHWIESDPPVLPGVPVTGSAWVTGSDSYVMLQFAAEDGSLIGATATSEMVFSSHVGVRASVTATPPEGAAMVRLSVRDADRAARPAVTWTDRPMSWGDGLGCPKAVVDQVTHDVVRALPQQMLSNVGFTVTEVG